MEQERRKHRRIPAVSMVKEALIESPELRMKRQIPAIVFNLSAGGVAFVTFDSFPLGAAISLDFNLNGLKLEDVEGRVVRVKGKKQTYVVVIAFTKIRNEVKNRINTMADAFDLCETRIMMGDKDVCSKDCSFFQLCTKPARLQINRLKN